jgi:hypothetical protein
MDLIGEPLCILMLEDGSIVDCDAPEGEPYAPVEQEEPLADLPLGDEPYVAPEVEDFTVRPEREGFGRG